MLVASALGVITARNPVHCALFLVLAFLTSAVIWLLLEAEFLAIMLVLVYVGAVMVLFLFVVMMLDVDVEKLRAGLHPLRAARRAGRAGRGRADRRRGRGVRGLGLDGAGAGAAPKPRGLLATPRSWAQLLYTQYLYPFELAAVILLVAIVAAITLTMRQPPGPEGAGRRRSRSRCGAADRIRVVKMDAEGRQ